MNKHEYQQISYIVTTHQFAVYCKRKKITFMEKRNTLFSGIFHLRIIIVIIYYSYNYHVLSLKKAFCKNFLNKINFIIHQKECFKTKILLNSKRLLYVWSSVFWMIVILTQNTDYWLVDLEVLPMAYKAWNHYSLFYYYQPNKLYFSITIKNTIVIFFNKRLLILMRYTDTAEVTK